MTWDFDPLSSLSAGCLILLVALLGFYSLRLRSRLRRAEHSWRELNRKLDTTTTELKRLSGLDALTGVANRGIFDKVLEREWARALRSRQTLGLIMIDIDRFKIHNDTYGHLAGDECLRQVARILKHGVRRPADLVARYGGEEFAVILPSADFEGATAVAERMRADVQALELTHAKSVTGHDVTISLGVAVMMPETGSSSATLVGAADAALYRAKAVGRNQVIVADSVERASETIDL